MLCALAALHLHLHLCRSLFLSFPLTRYFKDEGTGPQGVIALIPATTVSSNTTVPADPATVDKSKADALDFTVSC